MIFVVDNTSSSHNDSHKNNVLVLGQGPTDGINDTVAGTEEKDLVLTLVKKRQN